MTDEVQLRQLSPLLIVGELDRAVRFYQEHLAFELRYSTPAVHPFFAIVGREGAQLFLKEVSDSVAPLPNHARHPDAPWDAFVSVRDPDALARELESRDVAFHAPLSDRDDGLRGFEVADADGYVLFFGRPRSEALPRG